MPLSDQTTIYLIGPRASGKTTLGKMLAERLDRGFLDLDEAFVAMTGETIAELVARNGWERFREIEAEVLAKSAKTPGLVVATGGGVVLLEKNREILSRGLVIYLQAEPERLAERLIADMNPEQRPKLTGMGLKEEIVATLAEREPIYLSLAQVILPEAPIEELCDQAVRALLMF